MAEAKAEMDAAAKAARQRAKTAQQTSKPDASTRKEESATPVAAPADSTPSLFPAQTQTEKSGTETSAPERTVPFGYENDCGGFGDVVLNVAERKITVERNDRFEDYTTTSYEV